MFSASEPGGVGLVEGATLGRVERASQKSGPPHERSPCVNTTSSLSATRVPPFFHSALNLECLLEFA